MEAFLANPDNLPTVREMHEEAFIFRPLDKRREVDPMTDEPNYVDMKASIDVDLDMAKGQADPDKNKPTEVKKSSYDEDLARRVSIYGSGDSMMLVAQMPEQKILDSVYSRPIKEALARGENALEKVDQGFIRPTDTYVRKIRVERVVDGDTIDVEVDLGYKMETKQRIRLLGIDAPEVRGVEKSKGLEAKKFLQNLLPEGQEAWMMSYKSDSFGRYLGIIWLELAPMSVNDELLSAGYAKPWEGRRA